jgi:predicted HAD superfamily phosphohydrolase YqeG
MKPKIIFVDVDDTLVRSVGTKRIPMPSVIAGIKKLKAEGALLYLWSSGGAMYCQETGLEFGLEGLFEAFLPKPTVYIDDQVMSDWRFCRHVLPLQVEDA